MQYFLALNFIN